MKILVFGAAFDPPHNGHMIMAREVVANGLADKVIFVPCGTHAFAKNMSLSRDRFEMTKSVVDELIAEYGNHFELSGMEIEREGISYASETLGNFAKMYPQDEIGWLMGSDQLDSFDKWQNYEEILAKYPVYVYPRKDYPFIKLQKGMIKIENVPEIEISSSEIRKKESNGGEIASMVTPKVAEYIKEHKLWTK